MSFDGGMSTFGFPPFDMAPCDHVKLITLRCVFVRDAVENYRDGGDRQRFFRPAVVFLRRVLSGVRRLGQMIVRFCQAAQKADGYSREQVIQRSDEGN